MWVYVLCISVLVLHYFYDTHYLFRVFIQCSWYGYLSKKIHPFNTCTMNGFCTTTDLGLAFDHMNNVRHLREYDICRFRFMSQTRLLLEILKRGGNALIAGVNVRYRLPIKTFSRYEVKTKLLWWDPKFAYFDQRIVTSVDGVIRASALVKMSIGLNWDVLLSENFPGIAKPELPAEVKAWVNTLEIMRECHR